MRLLPSLCWLLLFVWGLTAGMTGRAAAEESLWQTYVDAALQAERDEDSVSALRAWDSAAKQVPKDPTRLALARSHLALAQAERKMLTEARATIAAVEPILKTHPAAGGDGSTVERGVPAPLRDPTGTLHWAKGIVSTQASSPQRASEFRSAVLLLGDRLPLERRARLLREASLASLSAGEAAQAARLVEAAIGLLDAQPKDQRRPDHGALLAEDLVLAALADLDLDRAGTTLPLLTRWKTIDEKLEADRSRYRPSRPALRLAAARRFVALQQYDEALEELAPLKLGGPDQAPLPEHPLATEGELLRVFCEAHVLRGTGDDGPALVDRLKRLSASDPSLCGRALRLEGVLRLRAGELFPAAKAFGDSVQCLETGVGKEHPLLVRPLVDLALVKSLTGHGSEAVAVAARVVGLSEKTFPLIHRDRAASLESLARAELALQHAEEARQFARKALDLVTTSDAATDGDRRRILALLARSEAQCGSRQEAARLLQQFETLDAEASSTFERAVIAWEGAQAAHLIGETGAAEGGYQDSLRILSRTMPDRDHPMAALPRLGLATLRESRHDVDVKGLQETLAGLRRLLGSDENGAVEISRQANAFYTARQYREAVWLYDVAIAEYVRLKGSESETVKSLRGYRSRAFALMKPM